MQDALLPPSQPPVLSFSSFFTALIRSLEEEDLRPCILRNYEGFPANNIGRDIDFLISPSQLPRAIRAIQSMEGVQIVGYLERPSVALVYLEGISPVPGARGLEVDFDLSLAWKGLPFLTTDAVLQAAIPCQAGDLTFLVPSQVHEAVISLFASLLVAGWLKEKYFPKVQRTFAGDRSGVIAALLPQFGLKAAARLVDSVTGGDRRQVTRCIRSLRISLALRSLLRKPFRGIPGFVHHYMGELIIRLSPKTLETVCFVGLDGGVGTTIVETLIDMLQSSAAEVENSRPWSRVPFMRKLWPAVDSRAQAPWGYFTSMAKVVAWLLDDWIRQFVGNRNLTLRLCENCAYGLLVAPQNHRYGGPVWFARLACKFFPSPDLWIVLDLAPESQQPRNHEIPLAETVRQLEAYRAFVKTRKSYVILDASRPVDQVVESAYAAITEMLAMRAAQKLKNRFQGPPMHRSTVKN